jgi:diketogulonate reductase-like aldo/keto reductase
MSLPAAPSALITKTIPQTAEKLPAIGMGSWITFDVEYEDKEALATRVEVLQRFFDKGGALIDSSPMYGESEEVIGYCLKRINNIDSLFSATKVWTWGRRLGISQMENSEEFWGVKRIDLMQIHNLLDWKVHIKTLRQWKDAGRIRYLGITTSHGRRHDEVEQLLKKEKLDFVQFTYNMIDREAEQRLLPLAADQGVAVIINRPFQGGDLFPRVEDKPLPDWAGEIDCSNWACFFLKYIISHPHVTCAIPATSQPVHMEQNMGACYGRLPDVAMRKKMQDYFEAVTG